MMIEQQNMLDFVPFCGLIFALLRTYFTQNVSVKQFVICTGAKELSKRLSFASAPMTPRKESDILESSNLKTFTFNELRIATRNFRPDSVLGEGGFGCVFKGWIDENTFKAARPGTGLVIAAKRLNQEGLQGHKEWLVSAPTRCVYAKIYC